MDRTCVTVVTRTVLMFGFGFFLEQPVAAQGGQAEAYVPGRHGAPIFFDSFLNQSIDKQAKAAPLEWPLWPC
jgi:hypothetical protein